MGQSSSDGPSSAINVTPLVDVCLVLLIIFIVLVPQDVPEISVHVPRDIHSTRTNCGDPLVLGLDEAGSSSLNGVAVATRDELGDLLVSRLQGREKKVVYAKFDDAANYGEAVALLDLAKRSGAEVLGVTKREGVVPDTLIGV